MAAQDRTAARALGLGLALEKEPYSYDFFQAVRQLECVYRDKPRIGRSARPTEDPIRLGQDPSLAFAPSSLSSYRPAKGGRPPRLGGLFFGLFGPNGPLPTHLTEYAYDRQRNSRDPTFARFADVFHHRMLALFYRAWANARPAVSFDRPDADWFGDYLASLFGFGHAALRNRDAMPDLAKLHYAGLLACQTRHADGLRQMIADFFKLPARIVEFVGAWMDLPEDGRCRLGESPQTGALGLTAIAGARVWGCQQKFRIVLGPMNFNTYRRLLPGGESLERLVAVVRNYTGDELAWEVNMVLKRDELPPLKLGEGGRLGWTTWLGDRRASEDADDLVLDAMAYVG